MKNGDTSGTPTSETRNFLIAEGDSWFAFSPMDVLDGLRRHRCIVRSIADPRHKLIRDIAYPSPGENQWTNLLPRLPQHGVVPRAVLLCGGGNDLVGRLKVLLNDSNSGLPILDDAEVSNFLEELQEAFVHIVQYVTTQCSQTFQLENRHEEERFPIPILVHGYAYAIPDGRRLFGWGRNWLDPVFDSKGHKDLIQNIETMKELIDQFNEMVKSLSKMEGLEHVRYVNLRPHLNSGLRGYRHHWQDELHPTEEGFKIISQVLLEEINKLPASREMV